VHVSMQLCNFLLQLDCFQHQPRRVLDIVRSVVSVLFGVSDETSANDMLAKVP
jgi:hypothetical protein